MFRQTIILFLFIFGAIATDYSHIAAVQHLFSDRQQVDKSNGNLLFISNSNTDEEIAHQNINHERLKLVKDVDGVLHYSLGARVSSDRLVASGGQNQSWPDAHNVNIQLTYPSQGYGAAVTYVAIVVNQTSNLGQAYVVKGGINQHLISIVVEAYNTYVFNVFAYVYGV